MLASRFRLVRLLLVALVLSLTGPVTVFAAFPVGEDCDNCIDDDDDDLVDREDPECSLVANGSNQGLDDPARGKILATCAKTTQKAGFKFILGVMKRFQKCTQAAATCIQAKPNDPGCQTKATATCAKVLGAFDADAAKLQAVIVAKCDPAGQNIGDIRSLTGLGFQAEENRCAFESDAFDLSTIQNIGLCIAQQHFCKAQHLVAIATPRAREFLRFAGRPDGEFPCIDEPFPGAEGNGSRVEDSHVKKLLKCGKTIDKLALTLLGSGAKTAQNCLNAGIACLQVNPTDTCVDKARAKCAAGFAKLQDPAKGTVAKLAAKFLKACGVQENLSFGDLVATNGIGLTAELGRCQDLGASDPAACFGVQAFCEGGHVFERQVPRARELATFLGVVIPGFNF